MSVRAAERSGAAVPLAAVVAGMWVAVTAWFVILGSDLMWVVALGDVVRAGDGIPRAVPFAAADQSGWENPIVLAEVLLSAVHATGPWALAVLQVGLVAVTLAVLVAEGRRLGGSEGRVALALSLAVVGASVHLVITRLPSLSLVPFVLALLVMRRQHERPGRGVWWLVPLYLVWGNLHGGVLVGLAVLGVYLVLSPGGGPLLRRVGVGVGCGLSLLLTSAGLGTPAYYVTALGNEAAARNTDLWARPSLTHPLDVAMIGAALVLLVLAARRRPPLWEWAAAAGLVVGVVEAGRNGIWLLLFLVPAAARAAGAARTVGAARTGTDRTARASASRTADGVVAAATVGLVVVAVLVRGPALAPPGADVVERVRAAADGRVVLADEPLAETLGQGGVTVWAANPIDAFPREVQADFLDFLHDGTVPDDPVIGLVVVAESLAPAVAGSGGWAPASTLDGHVVLERTP